MSMSKIKINSWFIPVVLYFVYPKAGTIFIIIKVIPLALTGLKRKLNFNNNTSYDQKKLEFNEIKHHNIDFSHDHGFNDDSSSSSNNSNIKVNIFESEKDVRCHICYTSNFVKELPSKCEYFGSQIVKI